jgi:hypothetical protein
MSGRRGKTDNPISLATQNSPEISAENGCNSDAQDFGKGEGLLMGLFACRCFIVI